MRASDYIASRLEELKIKRVYGLMGGGAACLNDAFIKNKYIDYICFHHEQGAANAAIGESKTTNKLTVVNPTTGCGGTNCITSLLDAWQDSLPVLFISGNVRSNQISSFINFKNDILLRKYGLQEHDIISTVQSITKFSKIIDKIEDVPFYLEKAIDIATSPRMGPVWLDIPSDIQSAQIPEKYNIYNKQKIDNTNKINFNDLIPLILKSKKPLILVGYGITLSESQNKFKQIIEKYKIPFVTSYLAIDVLGHDHPYNIGTVGVKGSRAGNFAIQNCDLLIVLGCSLNCSHTGYDEKLFSPKSYKIVVDIDQNELNKKTIKIDKPINCELNSFLSI